MESFNIALVGTFLILALALILSYYSGVAGQTAMRSDFELIALLMGSVWVILAILGMFVRRQK